MSGGIGGAEFWEGATATLDLVRAIKLGYKNSGNQEGGFDDLNAKPFSISL
jgi:hypothetical protein